MAGKSEAYVDTSALIALCDRSDTYHALFRRLFSDPPALVTTALLQSCPSAGSGRSECWPLPTRGFDGLQDKEDHRSVPGPAAGQAFERVMVITVWPDAAAAS